MAGEDDDEFWAEGATPWGNFYPGGFMQLEIHGDGHVGHTVTDVKMIAD